MARSRTKQRRAPKKLDRRPAKKRVCVFCGESVKWVDYKDADLLRRYLSERAKIRSRRVTGNCRVHQAQVARAIKLARELALLPYAQRQVTVRTRKPRSAGPGGPGGGRGVGGPMPEPTTPPPPPRGRADEEEGEFEVGAEGAELGQDDAGGPDLEEPAVSAGDNESDDQSDDQSDEA